MDLLSCLSTHHPFSHHSFDSSPHEGPAVLVLGDDGLDLVLQPRGRLGPPLGVLGGDGRPIGDLDLHLAVGKVIVGGDPVAGRPALRVQHGLDKEHVGDGIAHGLQAFKGQRNDAEK